MSFDKEMIRVYNYGSCGIAMKTHDRSVLLSGVVDHEYPSMETFTLKELEYVNTHSPVIKNGMIEFEESEREEVYKALHCSNWRETCIFEREIDEMLTTATFETMKKVVDVKDIPTIDRIYAHMLKLMRTNAVDVSSRVQKVVTVRRNELREGIMTSRIQLVPKKVDEPKLQLSQEEINRLIQEQVQAAVTAAKSEVAAAQVEEPVAKEPVENVIETKAPARKTTRTTKKAVK